MAGQTKGRGTAGNVLIALGAIVILGAAGYFLWSRYQGYQLRAGLERTPAPSSIPVKASPTSQPAPTVLPPTPTPSPTGAPLSPTAAASGVKPTSGPAIAASPAVIVTPAPIPTAPPTSAPAGPPVRLVIPDLSIDIPVVEMVWEAVQTAQGTQTEWIIPENEAGHHIDSAQLGETGNLVISGHNNIYGRVFERISLAWPGKASKVDNVTERSDILNGRTLQLYNQAGQRFDYAITDFLRLKDTGVPLAQRVENARYMRPTDDTRLTLVTCWPPWSNTHRLIVIAKPAEQP